MTNTAKPVAAVIAVVIRADEILLVRRANEPDAGLWGFPGGKIEFGESMAAAAVRELFEETQVEAEAGPVLTALDVFEPDAQGAARRHFVLVAVRCRWLVGEPRAGDDALEARWFPLAGLDRAGLPMSRDVLEVARQAAAHAD